MASGKTELNWKAGREFFELFGNSDILDADLDVVVTLRNHGITIDVECSIDGWVTVPCDRCLDDLRLAVKTGFEDVYTPESDELDLSQDVYDYVCISLPLQRVHPEGECNPETIKFLSK
ncbi:MAG: DUF177 domain-containing protein [Bacteroidales bacterium]|nr:DUF177 domain-containing protein [Bacteroidales bacterium]